MLNALENTCAGCFEKNETLAAPCPSCGFDENAAADAPHRLRPRTILNGKYMIGRVLGEGGFGITYLGLDLNLGIKVAIKEYYPSGYVTREVTSHGISTVQPFTGTQGDFFIKGREKFVGEARTLAKFFTLPGIVSVKDFFSENGTAYISMEYIDGQTLKSYLVQMGGKIPAAQVFGMMNPVMSSLGEIHKTGLIHRDISPDNIMISKDGQMKLLDFGAARDFTDSGNKSMSIMLKPGYAPEEQYRSKGVQGPWTDVYALAATMYKCITGVTPDESVERTRMDTVKPPSALGIAINQAQEAALMKGMAVLSENRFQNTDALHRALYGTMTGQGPVTYSAMPSRNTMPHPAAVMSPPVSEPAVIYPETGVNMPPYQAPYNSYAQPAKKSKTGALIAAVVCFFLIGAGALAFFFGPWGESDSLPETSRRPSVSAAPAMPAGLSAVFVNENHVRLSWDTVEGASSYEVQYFRVGISDWEDDPDYGKNTETSFVSEVFDDKETRFRIRAVNDGGASDWAEYTHYPQSSSQTLVPPPRQTPSPEPPLSSAPAPTPVTTPEPPPPDLPPPSLSAPTGLNAVPAGLGYARVSWNAVAGAEYYEAEWMGISGGWFVEYDYTDRTATTFTASAWDGIKFRVRAVNSSGASGWAETTYREY